MFWAPTRTALPRERSTTSPSAEERRADDDVASGAGDPRQQGVDELAASATVLCIFQLAAM